MKLHLLLLLLLGVCAAVSSADSRSYDLVARLYVAPRTGNDSWPGTASQPLATLPAAVIRARDLHRNTSATSSVGILLAGNEGPLQLQTTLTLGHADSHLVITAADSTSVVPVISGGITLGGTWTPAATAGVWSLALDSVTKHRLASLPHGIPNTLYIDGVRATRARSPNKGSYYHMMGPLASANGEPDIHSGFTWAPGDLDGLAQAGVSLDGVEVVAFQSWQAQRRAVAAVTDTGDGSINSRSLRFGAPGWVWVEPRANSGSRYYVENHRTFCDNAGEWFLDMAAGQLLYLPLPGQRLSNATTSAVMPGVVGDLVVLDGAQDVTLQGVSLQHVDWNRTEALTQSGNRQAASFTTAAALRLHNASGCSLVKSSVERVGGYGVWLHGGSVDCSVQASLVRDTGAGGIRLGAGNADGTSAITIANTTVVYGGAVFPAGNGILVQRASHNMIVHNEVAYFDHVGVCLGWTWDYSPSGAHNNTLMDNHVHHVGNGILSDLAGIYTLGISPGTQVARNLVHDATPYYVYGHGMYADQATSGVVFTHNVVHSTLGAAWYQHFGRNNSVTNNVFAAATGGWGLLWQDAQNCPDPSNFVFQRNIVAVNAATVRLTGPVR